MLITAFVLISCASPEKEIPKDVIPKEKMVGLITEVELTQALIKLKSANKDTIESKSEMFEGIHTNFEELFKEFSTTEEQFNNSLTYYGQKPETLENIYLRVINNLSKKQAENN